MSRKLKVSIIEPVGGHGGMDYYDLSLCNELKKFPDLHLNLYTSEETVGEGDSYFNIKKPFKKIYGKENKYLRGFRFIKALIVSLFKSKLDGTKIVHYHFFHTSILELLCIIFAKTFRMKVVITAHDVESFVKGSSQKLAKIIYSSANSVIVHNNVSKNELEKKLSINSKKINIIPHGNYISVANSSLGKEVSIEKLGLIEDGCKVLLFFGQIKEVKGLDILISALPMILEKHKNVRVLIAGRPWKDDFTFYLRKIQELDLEKNFTLHIQYIDNENVDYYFNVADLVILPYRKIYQSGVLLNAMSYKKPVIASDLPGMKEIINHNETGFLFKSGDEFDLAKCIITALDNEEKLSRIGENGFNKVIQNNNWRNIALQTKNLYLKLLK